MSKLFGTDGIRGVANRDLTPEMALRLGRAAAAVIGAGKRRPRVVIARDTRASGDMLASALAAGLLSAGANVIRTRVLPTPAVAFLVTDLGADAGAVISASHNPAEDNGIKFFGPDGFKLSDDQEAAIEEAFDRDAERPVAEGLGRLEFFEDVEYRYVNHALAALEGRTLEGLRIVVDCAHGASHQTTPEAFRRAGAEALVIGAEPDGLNINMGCGSVHPEAVAARVTEVGADLGIAHDGDADRVIAVDEAGSVVDGDHMLAALALEMKEAGRLAGNRVVATVMANLGFKQAMSREGIEVLETKVGDRYVLEEMRAKGAAIGGEQSGHLIFLDFGTTGDGLITALRLAGHMASSGRKLSDIAAVVTKFPQVLLNVRVPSPAGVESSAQIIEAVEQARQSLGSQGRILVRASGTEPLVRIMVEAAEESTAGQIARDLAGVVDEMLGAGAQG
ncbi:MAG: phosphoglucosamine mutase [Actinomycetota bacterium]